MDYHSSAPLHIGNRAKSMPYNPFTQFDTRSPFTERELGFPDLKKEYFCDVLIESKVYFS
jgi:hypothetical protein